MEAVCYLIAFDYTLEWNKTLDGVIKNIRSSQDWAVRDLGDDYDGYVSTRDLLNGTSEVGGGQVYNFGHLMTTGTIHHRATGKKTLLNASQRTGHFLWSYMQDYLNQPWQYWDHTTVMGGVELYRETGDSTFFQISDFIKDLMYQDPQDTMSSNTYKGADDIHFSCYPTPFNNNFTINIQSENYAQLSIEIINLVGQIVSQPFEGQISHESKTIHWDGNYSSGGDLPKGIYTVLLRANRDDANILMKRMILKR